MKHVKKVEEALTRPLLRPGSRIYCSGTRRLPRSCSTSSPRTSRSRTLSCSESSFWEISKRVLSGMLSPDYTPGDLHSAHSRFAVNNEWAMYQLLHLSDIPRQIRKHIHPNIAFISVAGPDNGGNFSLGTTVEGVLAAIEVAKANNGLVIAERNMRMPFVIGTTITADMIDYLVDTDYDLPVNPSSQPDGPIEENWPADCRFVYSRWLHPAIRYRRGPGGGDRCDP